ncbi:MAG: galactose mutarotase [Pedobacter sp.]|nr:galactose mutarotase [Pedobacter sp.]
MKTNLIRTGKVIDGKEVLGIELTNTKGSYVKIYNYGAIVSKFIVTNAHGDKQDIVLGFDDIEQYVSEEYLAHYPYLGAVIGRYANRVKGGQFCIDGKSYHLFTTPDGNSLHGGAAGFDKKVWEVLSTIDPSVTLQYISPAGEEGYPGNLTVQLTYKLSDDDELIMDIKASTDAPTAVNFTHHGYFNLAPDGGSVANHVHRIPASNYLEQNDDYTVTGKILPVEGTIYDFLGPKPIGQDWDPAEGYDQSFVLDQHSGEMTLASETTEAQSGLKLSVYTTEPIAHFYTAKYTDVKNGKAGKHYAPFSAFCVETQHAPNAINIPEFPGTLLRPNETYSQSTIFKIEHLG